MTDFDISNELKIIALEAINNAGSGHSGSVLSAGDVLFTLYTKHLVANPYDSKSFLRDRFVLSNGHTCAILYSILANLDFFSPQELKKFRQFGGKLSGHPEISVPGVDSETGPLGQGIANAVGMAIAETIMNAKFGLDCYTYCMTGDGCLQEGVGLEALSIAGLYKLNKFILLYDKNDITLDGKLENSSIDNIKLKFKSMNFNVLECNGHNLNQINRAITKAKASKNKPTVIIFNTIIGKDTHLAGSNLSHGTVYTKGEIEKLKQTLNVTNSSFKLSETNAQQMQIYKHQMIDKFNARKIRFEASLTDTKRAELKKCFSNIKFKLGQNSSAMSTRQAFNIALNEMAEKLDNVLTLSADISSRTLVKINNGGQYSANNRLGKNIDVGIREHAMGAVANGIALFGGFKVFTSTFLTFSNYMLPAIRMASIMQLPVMFAFSHSSVYDTLDGITHLPVEQLDQLRLVPNMMVSRPANKLECNQTLFWFAEKKLPMCVCLSRCNLIDVNLVNNNVENGAYFITKGEAKINIMASGSEVKLAYEVKECLSKIVKCNVISVPCLEIFEQSNNKYKQTLLNKPLFVVESGCCVKYFKYTLPSHIFNVTKFGLSGDEQSLKQFFGYTAENISKKIIEVLNFENLI